MNVSPLRKRPALSFVRKTDKDGDGRYAEERGPDFGPESVCSDLSENAIHDYSHRDTSELVLILLRMITGYC